MDHTRMEPRRRLGTAGSVLVHAGFGAPGCPTPTIIIDADGRAHRTCLGHVRRRTTAALRNDSVEVRTNAQSTAPNDMAQRDCTTADDDIASHTAAPKNADEAVNTQREKE